MDEKRSTGARGDEIPLYWYRLGSAEFDEARFELRVHGLVVDLERKPLQVLTELLRHADHVVTRKQLLDSVWNGRPIVEHALANTISKLRKALDDPDGNRIVTVPRKGYKCVGPIERRAVGRRIVSRLSLKQGHAVPGRGDFELLSQLGASFGNEVWLAQHRVTHARRVFKFNLHGEGLAALKREATIHRLLRECGGEHTDWVRMLAWNFEVPPFHLEYEYGGGNLDTWASTDDRLRSLSLEARLDLFLQVADAVATAHGIGVLHKDIKPTNILVAPRPEGGWQLRVADFGCARLLEPERLEELAITRLGATFSGTGDGAGTPMYMAPELLAGAAATVMSDVYSLGILLFQLSIGDIRKPLTSDWERDIPDMLLREDIALSTAGSPQRRLSSVIELTKRIRTRYERNQFLVQQQAAARRAITTERAIELAKARRPWLVASVLSLIAGLTVSLMLYRGEFAARHAAVRENMRTQAVNAFLGGVLRSVDPIEPGGSANTPIQTILRRATDRLQSEFSDDPVTKAAISLSLAQSFFGLSQYATALPLNQQAVALRSKALGTRDPATLEAQYHLARTLDMLSVHTEARRVLDDADHVAGSVLERNPKLAFLAYSTRGGNYLLQMQAALALEQFQKTEVIRRELALQDDEWLIHVRSNIAWCDVRLGRDLEAIQALAPLMTAHYTPHQVGVAEWIKLHLQYAVALTNLARFDDAAQTLADTRNQAEQLLGPSHYLVGLTWNYTAAAYRARGRWQDALDAARRAYDIWRGTVTANNQATLAALADIAVIHYLERRSDTGLAELQAAHEAFEKLSTSKSPFTQYVDFYLANALVDIGRPTEAASRSTLLNATELSAADPAPDWEARVRGLQGRIKLAQHRNTEAQELLQGAVSTLMAHKAQSWVVDPLVIALRAASTQRTPMKPMQLATTLGRTANGRERGRGPRRSTTVPS